jgi:hypothetical protein
MAESKLILMSTKKPPNWQEWNELKSEKQVIKEAITMIQAEARSILDSVMGAESTEQACEILKKKLPDRKHLTYWLGQIGRRADARLGKNLDYRRYINAVAEHLRSQDQQVVIVTRDRDKKPKRKIVKQAKAADRDSPKSKTDHSANQQEEPVDDKTQLDEGGLENGSQSEQTTSFSEKNSEDNQAQEPEMNPSTPHLSRVQDYALRNLLVFADCCVQTCPEGIFDVLARNFDSVGALGWWLQRVGKGELIPRTKGKDLIDALRIVAHNLCRELKAEIGKPVARW